MTLHESVLRAKLESIQRREQKDDRRSRKRFIGIHAPGWLGRADLEVGGETFRVVFCPSVLAVREQMADMAADGPRVVIVTDRDEKQLGVDVQARVFRNRFQSIDPWGTVLEMFQATRLGPKVPQAKWLQEELAAATAVERPPLAAGNILDLETIKDVVFRRLELGARPDARALLDWAADEKATALLARPVELRQQVRAWIEDTAGATGGLMLDSIEAGHTRLALPLGVVLRCVVGESAGVVAEEQAVVVRLERFVGNRKVKREQLVPWVEAAEARLRAMMVDEGARLYQPVLDAAEDLLEQLGAKDLAHRSSLLRSGLAQREQRFAEACELVLKSGSPDLAAVEIAAKAVASHRLAEVERRRAIPAAVEMAVRLLRWLNRRSEQQGGVPQSFAEAALAYAHQGSFVDWAREMTTMGYPHEALQQTLRSLWSAVTDVREQENQRFAALCADWSRDPRPLDALVPLESVLDQVVAPLVGSHKVLLLVLDGASLAVFHEIAADLIGRGWIELGPSADGEIGARRYGLAAFPTVTEVSRTSLLTGKVQVGGQATERSGFEGHAALGKAPRLLHKDALSGDRVGIDPGVAKVVTSDSHVVGVVINAIDDWLGKGDQDVAPWNLDRIRPLTALLELASQAERVVLITSDHGHVREHDTSLRAAGESSRHREPGALADGELFVTGPRVCFGDGRVAVPWTERLRYTAPKQNGYHGGVTPQEVLVPLALFVRPGQEEQVDGYRETPPGRPGWWDGDAGQAVAPRKTASKAKPTARKAPDTLPFQSRKQDLIDALFQSELFQAQREAVMRGWPGDDRLRAVLLAFAERGDAMTVAALANTLSVPTYRLSGMLANFRRALNVDGSEGLEFDVESGTVRVQWDILQLQFGLEPEKKK